MSHLKSIDLTGSRGFAETSNFSTVPSLEHLHLSSCISLVEVHPSPGKLNKLVEVDLESCENLKILPKKLETNSLTKLDLRWCYKLKVLPAFAEVMTKLSDLDVRETAITRLPISLGSSIGLRDLDMSHCKILNYDVFGRLSSLIVLGLSENDFVNPPIGCFSSLFQLVFLSMKRCKKLKSLPRLPPRLIRLDAACCDSMEAFSERQLWDMVASLDHEYRGRIKYVISNEECDDIPLMFKHAKPECLPLTDFYAIIRGRVIPCIMLSK